MLLSACGSASSVQALPTSLPTARIVVRPTVSGVVVPVQPPLLRAAGAPAELLSAEPSPMAAAPLPSVEPAPASASNATVTIGIVVSPNGPSAATEDMVATREALLVVEINQVRAANGLPPYKHSPEL